ncbi:hypothetical protein Tco_1501741 [Tanacetum coccineum]
MSANRFLPSSSIPCSYGSIIEIDEDAIDKEVKDRVKNHKRKHDSDDDEDDDDDEGPSIGSNLGQDEGPVLDLEDTDNAHIPKVLTTMWFKSIPEGERPATPEPEWTIPPNDFPEPENNWANTYATSIQVYVREQASMEDVFEKYGYNYIKRGREGDNSSTELITKNIRSGKDFKNLHPNDFEDLNSVGRLAATGLNVIKQRSTLNVQFGMQRILLHKEVYPIVLSQEALCLQRRNESKKVDGLNGATQVTSRVKRWFLHNEVGKSVEQHHNKLLVGYLKDGDGDGNSQHLRYQ